jgi:methylated-DNA-[protein]-cysteine S-methyltransferase
MILHTSTFPTPLGVFSVAVDEAGSLVASAFGGASRLSLPSGAHEIQPSESRTRAAREQLTEYFSGGRRKFSLALATRGTPFQNRVWGLLAEVPFGSTRSYGDLAKVLKSSARAVGGAVGSNPYCPVVPCHRILGSDGSLTGFGFGLDAKIWLLKHEGIPCGG